jgi:hypothetical protein
MTWEFKLLNDISNNTYDPLQLGRQHGSAVFAPKVALRVERATHSIQLPMIHLSCRLANHAASMRSLGSMPSALC